MNYELRIKNYFIPLHSIKHCQTTHGKKNKETEENQTSS